MASLTPTSIVTYRADKGVAFDLSTTTTVWIVPVGGYTNFTAQATSVNGWSTAEITVKCCNNGVAQGAATLANAMGSAGMILTAASPMQGSSCAGVKFLVFQTTTAQASVDCDLTVEFFAKDS